MLGGGDNSLTLEELLERQLYPERPLRRVPLTPPTHVFSADRAVLHVLRGSTDNTPRHSYPPPSQLGYLYEYGVASSRGAIGELHHSVHVDRGLLVYLTVVEGEGVTRLRSIPLEGLTRAEGSTQALRVVTRHGGGLHTGVIAGGEHGCLHGGPTLELV